MGNWGDVPADTRVTAADVEQSPAMATQVGSLDLTASWVRPSGLVVTTPLPGRYAVMAAGTFRAADGASRALALASVWLSGGASTRSLPLDYQNGSEHAPPVWYQTQALTMITHSMEAGQDIEIRAIRILGTGVSFRNGRLVVKHLG